ncbi:unnamed protein product [Bursaphelenchus okinawaensis]|uniref:Endonuclease/exonuclease/phosphatase domain-containing protein n=1 Tax=Bursaphelenchus okinawaensis TaxID=465554 RepID=A0A811LE40_9BILA|nr:unnamed protein product [Bursaphelenchus okinawaensis]CAG9120717.1 unnamed protein product [Bursaphelenchus okinawaensis]
MESDTCWRRFPLKRLAQIGMIVSVILLLFYLTSSSSTVNELSDVEAYKGPKLRFMSFNLWFTGHMVSNGLEKVAKHIKRVDPDIVVLQEIQTVYELDELMDLLGPGWYGSFRGWSRYADDAIVSKHPFNFTNSFQLQAGFGIEITPANISKIRVVGLHLDWHSMGNYATSNKLVTKMEQIMAGESTPPIFNRVDQIKELLAHETFKKWDAESETVPIFVAGDFNSASHLDWMENRKEEHGGWVVEWPTTKMLMNAGFLDSYREKHPDPIKKPGHSWSIIQKNEFEWNFTIPEPQDRIDFIFFKSNYVAVKDSYLYGGDEPQKIWPNYQENDYPSDHYAMVTDFVFKS